MKIGVLGTGMVGKAIASKLAALGHEVTMGSRTASNEAANAWAAGAGPKASAGTFRDATAGADLVFLCVKGEHALEVLGSVGGDALEGRIVVDVTNPLDFSKGFPPSLTVCNTDSLAETMQRTYGNARFVKALNTMGCLVMVDPARIPGRHDVLLCGNDAGAKAAVVEVLRSFGWKAPIDLGDLSAARGLEAWLLLWVRLYGALGTPDFNLAIVRASQA